jgi:hypothetical protein
LKPYVVPAFPRGIQASEPVTSNYSTSPARNEQLFSLALVLIEIAFGNKLFKIHEPRQIPEKEGDQWAEYMKAKVILDSGVLQKEMGVAYAQIVKRCLYCDFGILEEDLNKKEM